MNEFLSLLKEFKNSIFDFKIFCGIIATILVFIFEIIFIRLHKKRNRRVERAIQMGHVAKAKRINFWDDDTSGYSVDSWFHATYEYKVNGKTYQYRYLGKVAPPSMIDLYFIENPHKAFLGVEKKRSIFLILFYVLPIAAAVVVINFLGGI